MKGGLLFNKNDINYSYFTTDLCLNKKSVINQNKNH